MREFKIPYSLKHNDPWRNSIYAQIKNNLMYDKFPKFKQTLDNALLNGFPIDYQPLQFNYDTLLMLALSIRGVSPDIGMYLLKNGANPNITNRLGQNGLMLAVFYRDSNIIKENALLEYILELVTDVNAKDYNGMSAFDVFIARYAIMYRDGDSFDDKLRLLLNAGADYSEYSANNLKYKDNEEVYAKACQIQHFIKRYDSQKKLETSTMDSDLAIFER